VQQLLRRPFLFGDYAMSNSDWHEDEISPADAERAARKHHEDTVLYVQQELERLSQLEINSFLAWKRAEEVLRKTGGNWRCLLPSD
jgi:hypothetical protein